jgi:hypothetical protein
MTDARWQKWADDARALSLDMRDKGIQLTMEGIAQTYERLAAGDGTGPSPSIGTRPLRPSPVAMQNLE